MNPIVFRKHKKRFYFDERTGKWFLKKKGYRSVEMEKTFKYVIPQEIPIDGKNHKDLIVVCSPCGEEGFDNTMAFREVVIKLIKEQDEEMGKNSLSSITKDNGINAEEIKKIQKDGEKELKTSISPENIEKSKKKEIAQLLLRLQSSPKYKEVRESFMENLGQYLKVSLKNGDSTKEIPFSGVSNRFTISTFSDFYEQAIRFFFVHPYVENLYQKRKEIYI